jgi:hypothetical protein
MDRPNKIIFYRVDKNKAIPGWNVHAASPKRNWMDSHTHMYRCLPMTIANQNGWVIECPCDVHAVWFGGNETKSMHFWLDAEYNVPNSWVKCHFLGGVITFEFDFIIRTTEKTNLLVRGAPNFYIDGLHPLEGLVETDWLNFTFTMNWKVTQPNKVVTFKKGDPICFIQPVPHNYSEQFEFEIDYLENNPEMFTQHITWHKKRMEFSNNRKQGTETRKWQRDYFDGKDVHTGIVQDNTHHATKLHLSDPVDQKLPLKKPIMGIVK